MVLMWLIFSKRSSVTCAVHVSLAVFLLYALYILHVLTIHISVLGLGAFVDI